MPNFVDLQWLSGAGILLGLLVTAALIVLIVDWRLALFSLAIQYIFLAFLLTSLLPSSIAVVRVVSGGLACSILYLSLRHNQPLGRWTLRRRHSPEAPPSVFIVGCLFRFFAVVFVGVSVLGFTSSVALFNLPTFVLFSSLWLVACGLLVVILSRDVLRLGLGLLLFTSGFTLLDTAIEGSLFLYGLINIADLLLALVISHLATLPTDVETQRRRGESG